MRSTVTDSHQTTNGACVPPVARLLLVLPRAVDNLDGRPRLEQHPTRLPTYSPAPFAFPPLACSSATTEQQLRHCRPCVTIVVRAHHRKNASANSFVASPWSSLLSPPHRRSNRVLVRTYASFSSTAAVVVLIGDGAPHGQLSSHPCHPSSVSR